MTQQQIIYLIFIPIIVWRLYSRMRKLIVRQEARSGRLWFPLVLFPLLTLMTTWGCREDMAALGSLIGGAACGAALAVYGLKLTHFDVEGGKLFYQPNRYIGMGLMMLFVTRLAYRFATMPTGPVHPNVNDGAAMQQLSSSPLTLFIMGLVFCYYAPYSAGILLRRARLGKPDATGENRQHNNENPHETTP